MSERYEAEVSVKISALPSAEDASRLNEDIGALVLDQYGAGPGDLVMGFSVNAYNPDDQQPEPEERRERYAAAILAAMARDTTNGPNWGAAADAAMAVADEKQQGLLKAIADLAVDIGHARQELSRVVLGQAQVPTDMSLEQIVAAAVAEYRSEVAAAARLRAELGQLKQNSNELAALERFGVDNWDGYGEAMRSLEEEN